MLRDPASGRTLTITTTEPGLQFFAGGMLDAPRRSAAARARRWRPSTSRTPPNRPRFPSTVLRAGERLTSTTVLSFSA